MMKKLLYTFLLLLIPQQALASFDPLSILNIAYGTGGGEGYTGMAIALFLEIVSPFAEGSHAYFTGFSLVLMPVTLAIWIAYRASQLFINHEETTWPFLKDVVSKLTLMFFLWAFISSNNSIQPFSANTAESNTSWSYNALGPSIAETAFDLSFDLRNHITDNDKNAELGCVSSFTDRLGSKTQYAQTSAEFVCTIERTTITGLAMSYALLHAGWVQVGHSIGLTTIGEFIPALFNALVSSFFALVLFSIFMSIFVWLLCKVLHVLIDVLFVAMFSPIFAFCYLYKPTRKYTYSGMKSLLGAVVTTIGIGLSLSFMFYLLHSVPLNYNTIIATGTYGDLIPISESNPIVETREFITRISIDPNGERAQWYIPFTFADPWFWHLLLVGLISFSVSRKFTTFLETIVGAPGFDQSNRSAASIAQAASKVATGGAVVAAGVATGGATTAAGLAMAASKTGASQLRKSGMPDYNLKNANIFGVIARRNAGGKQ